MGGPLTRDDEAAGGRVPPARALEMLATGAGLVLALALAARLPSWRAGLGRLQVLLVVAFALYAVALGSLRRWRGIPHSGLAVLAIAFAMRAALLPVEPVLSDDVYRYVWDGRVLLSGVNPYAHAPADPALAGLRDLVIHPRINHPALRTIYPPVAEAGFALVAAISPTVLGMKLWILLHDLALAGLLAWWCRARSGSALPAIAYAWNPLVVSEYAGSAHHDPTGILWLVVALVLARRRPAWSAVAFTAAALVKLLPIVALPFLFAVWPARARWLALALLAVGLGLFLALAGGPASGLVAFAASWRNNELLFHYAALALGERGARLAAAAVVVAIALWFVARGSEPWRSTRAALRAALLAGPVLHPWYLGWTLALEPLAPSAPWLLLSATALLNYGVFAPPAEGGGFHLPLELRWVEYGLPLLLGLALAARAAKRQAGDESV